VKSVKCKV